MSLSLKADDIEDQLNEEALAEDLGYDILEENPKIKPTWKMEWPITYYEAYDKKTGRTKTVARRPAGVILGSKFDGIPIRIKINCELGMIAIDRAWGVTCKWKTRFCQKHCYNKKLIAVHPSIAKAGKPDEAFWAAIDGEWLYNFLHSDRFEHWANKVGYSAAFMRGRLRLCTRGETFARLSDVDKVADLLEMNPQTVFWMPTRAWRNDAMANAIEDMVLPMPNARVQASTDPSNTAEEYAMIEERGWNTMFFGDDSSAETQGRFKCPKTWKKWKSYCRLCKSGCFKNDEVHVHLAAH